MKTIVITGASRGIGLALSKEFAIHDYTVVALCRNPDTARDLQSLADGSAGHVYVLQADITDQESLAVAVKKTASLAPGGVDVLVNNAGQMLSRETPDVEDFPLEQLEALFAVNTVAPLRVVQTFLPLLRHRAESSRIVNVTSVMGSLERVAERRNYSYSVSKAALNMLTRLLHQDLVGEGIGVFAIHPGWVQTDMGGDRAHFSPRESAAGLYAQITTWRPGDPELLDFQGRALPW